MIQTITLGQHNQPVIEQFDMSLCLGSYHTITGELVLPWGGDGVRGGNDVLYLKNSVASSGTAKLTFTLPQNTDANSQVRFEITTSNAQFDGAGPYTFNAPDGTTDTHTFSASEHYTWFCNASAGDVIMLTSTDGTSADIVSIIVTYIGSTSDTTKYVNDIIINKTKHVHLYELLDYIIAPQMASINTNVLVDGTTVVEMTAMVPGTLSYDGARFFSTNDTNSENGWGEPGTWGLQFEDSDHRLAIKVLGVSQDVQRTDIYWNDLKNRKLRYNLTASGYLNIYDENDNLYDSYDVSAQTNINQTSSSPIKLFSRYNYAEHIQQGSYIYSTKIWKNNVLIRNYVPAKQLSTNKCGLYDLVNNSFYINDDQNYSFGGVSKSTPEYIDDPVAQHIHINRIYHKGEIYWGNEPLSHNIDGTSSTTFGEIYFNRQVTGPGSSSFTGGVSVPVSWNGTDFYVDTLLKPETLVGCFAQNRYVRTARFNRLDCSNLTSIENIFEYCSNLQTVDVSRLNTSKVTAMGNIFAYCSKITSLDLSSWDVSKVTRIWGAFRNMSQLTSIDLSSWTTSSLQYISHTFYSSSRIQTINLSGWDVTHVTLSEQMFDGCSSLTTLDLSGWDLTLSLSQTNMFRNCSALTDVYITTQNTLNKLTNNLRSQGNNYIPSSATIHYDDGTTQCDYVWDGSGWVQSNS